jgi:hypothetical protein
MSKYSVEKIEISCLTDSEAGVLKAYLREVNIECESVFDTFNFKIIALVNPHQKQYVSFGFYLMQKHMFNHNKILKMLETPPNCSFDR